MSKALWKDKLLKIDAKDDEIKVVKGPNKAEIKTELDCSKKTHMTE